MQGSGILGARRRGPGARGAGPLLRGALAAVPLAAALAAPAAAFPGLSVVYAERDAAAAVYDGRPGLAGLTDAFRQAPVASDPRWPADWQAAKVSGRELSRLGARAMAATLRRAWENPAVGDLVGVDELVARDWPAGRARALRRALGLLGPDARRVVLYVGPALVGQVGRADPRQPLEPRLEAVLDALRAAGAVQLEMYQGGGIPWSRAQFAAYTTRWLERFAPGDPGKLHLLFGPARDGADHAELWARARATPAGRTLLANGAGVYGVDGATEGLDWLRGYRAFLADPSAPPPGGDVAVPTGGGLGLAAAGMRTVTVRLSRPARAVVSLRPAGSRRVRVIAKVRGPIAPRVLHLPPDVGPGRYRLRVVAEGDGLKDAVEIPFRVRAPLVQGAPDPRVRDAAGGPAAASLAPPADRADLVRRLVALDARYRPLLARAARCARGELGAARGLRRRAVDGAALASAPGLARRVAALAAGARRLAERAEPCAGTPRPEATPREAPAAPPGAPVAGPAELRAITLRELLSGAAIDLSAELGAAVLPAGLVPVDVAVLNGPSCREPGTVCVGLDRVPLQQALRELAAAGLPLGPAGADLLAGDLAAEIAVERAGDRLLRIAPAGPLAGLLGAVAARPGTIVGQVQVVPAVASGVPPAPAGQPSTQRFAPGAAPAELRLLAAVNRARAEAGRAPLRASTALARAARGHAARLERLGALSTSTAGAPFWTRLVAAGQPAQRALGENLSRVTGCDPAGAELTVRLWLASPAHRANLLSRRVRAMGAGAATDRACGATVYTADFGG
jgi:uncharacterized protein YkwD